MTDQQKQEAREARLQRDAFETGARWAIAHVMTGTGINETSGRVVAQSEQAYPMPTVERRRVVRDSSGVEYTTQLQTDRAVLLARFRSQCAWARMLPADFIVTEDRAALWADLFANPVERVPADEAGGE